MDMDPHAPIKVDETKALGAVALSIAVVAASAAAFALYSLFKKKGDSNGNTAPNMSVGLEKIEESNPPTPKDDGPVLAALAFKPFKLSKIEVISHNTKLYRFVLPAGKDLGLPIGRHVAVRAMLGGERVIRPYTPVSHPNQKGHFDLLIKHYNQGKLSSYFNTLKVGDSVDIRGPTGNFKYKPNAFKSLGLVGAGTGITPLLQVMRFILANPEDETKLHLMFQNREVGDILMHETIEKLAVDYPDRVKVTLACSRAKDWSSDSNACTCVSGYCDDEVLARDLPSSGPQSTVLLCGPEGFVNSMKGSLEGMGHSMFVF